MGGLLTFLSAVRVPVDAAVAYYGGCIDQHLIEAPKISLPLMLHLGEDDEYIPHAAQQKIEKARR
ncbi:dienelactone hydrolase family protein [Acidisoma silvae]|uniref:Dienelactone hydrolase family protein n=1 Tax=Acidisoma silvae TaxID=2802396 RepID=A0A964E0S7_9PROT|nr:dienelactone hydrolase family protein [Acidisoma silvae]